jgi:sarcosine oxidase subunit beta
LGVDIIENCEVTGFQIENGTCVGVETTRGNINAAKTAVCVAGSSGRVMGMAGMRLPIESFALQAFVTEGLKPHLPCAFSFGAGHFYVSQSDKGGLVFGGDLDAYNTYAQRGSLDIVQDVAECAVAVMPSIGRARLLRCYGGFKATPASGFCYAHLLATDTPHDVASAYRLDRSLTGAMIDEKGQGAHPNRH